MSDIFDAFDSPWGLTWALVKRHKQKKAIRNIQKSNEDARGIVYYQPSNIEAFFDERDHIGNIVLSGGDEFIRLRAMAKCVECAYIQGYVPVVLHTNNFNLENYFVSCFGTTNITYINGQFPFYEPFIGLSDNEICKIIMKSTTENFEIKGNGKNYIDGVTAFIRSKGVVPYLWMYITCPHMELSDKINDSMTKGIITENMARRMLSQLVQGEIERGNIENFFSELRSEAEFIIAKKGNLSNATSIRNVAKSRGAIVIDVRASNNELLLNIIISEIEMLKSRGEKVFLCIDGIQILDNTLLAEYLKSSGNQSVVCMSGCDVYSDFLGNDKLFYSIVGKSSKIVISKHVSAYSCQKFSEIVGSYDKQEISDTFTGNMNMVGDFSYGTTNSKNISIKREEIIKTDEIHRLNNNEVFILDNNNDEIAWTQVV